MRHARLFLFCSILLISAGAARGERRFIIGNQYDFLFGGTNQASFTSVPLQDSIAPFYGFYPSADMTSVGRNTQFDIAYTALAERFDGNQKMDSLAHVANAGFAARAGRRLKLDFSASFSSAPDYTNVDVLRGEAPPPDEFQFVFEPAFGKSTRQTVRGAAGAVIDLDYRSYLTMDLSALSLKYTQKEAAGGALCGAPASGSASSCPLLDQLREEGRVGYWYHLNAHEILDLQYVFIENDYSGNGKGRTQSAVIGYTRDFSPALQMHFEAGPAYVTFDGTPSYYGYMALVSVKRTIGPSEVSSYYSHAPGDSSGLGSLSNIHTAGISIFSPLWRHIAIGSSIAGFAGRAVGNGSNNYQGFYGSLDLSYPLSRRWFLTCGGSYKRNAYGNPLDHDLKRLYVSLRFRAPDLWRTSL